MPRGSLAGACTSPRERLLTAGHRFRGLRCRERQIALRRYPSTLAFAVVGARTHRPAVAVEVAAADDLPGWLATPAPRLLRGALPDFQITLAPVCMLRQNISDLPSPSKSPMPTTFQPGFAATAGRRLRRGGVARLPDHVGAGAGVAPEHIGLPSPSKSPTPTTSQLWLVTAHRPPAASAALPDFQIALAPVPMLRQKTSDLPSPSKSPIADDLPALVGHARHRLRRRGVARLPDRIGARAVIAPEHIGLAVAIEVACPDDVPVSGW